MEKREIRIKDYMPLTTTMKKRNIHVPFRGVLYRDDGLDAYGRPIFTKVNENTVTLGGAIFALEKITGQEASFKPNTLNSILNVNNIGYDYNLANTTIALFGCGIGGAALDFGNVYDPNVKQNNVAELVPMMVAENDLTGTDSDKYMMATTINTTGGTTLKCWYLKEAEQVPVIRSLWKDAATEEEDGTEITEDISASESLNDVECFAQYKIKLLQDDVRSYFNAMGMLSMARYNTIGLYTGEKVTLPNGKYDYVNVRLFSVVNLNNEPLDERKDITYYYRIYAMV